MPPAQVTGVALESGLPARLFANVNRACLSAKVHLGLCCS